VATSASAQQQKQIEELRAQVADLQPPSKFVQALSKPSKPSKPHSPAQNH